MTEIRHPANPRIAAHFRRIRKSHGLTVAEMARRAGIPRGAIDRIERGERGPSLEMTCKIAAGLGLDAPRFLLGLEWQPWDTKKSAAQ